MKSARNASEPHFDASSAPTGATGEAPASPTPATLPDGPAATLSEPIRQSNKHLFPGLVDLLVLLGIFFLCQLVGSLLAIAFGLRPNDLTDPGAADPQTQLGLFLAFSYTVSMVLALLFSLLYRHRRRGPTRTTRYAAKGFNPAILLWGFVMMISASIVIEPLLALLPPPPATYGRGMWTILMVVVAAPVLEEFYCRGFLLGSLRVRYGTAGALLVSSLFFAVIHLNPTLVINAFVMGIVLGYVYIRTDSIWASILLHALNNAVALMLIFFSLDDMTLSAVIGNGTAYGILYTLASVVFALATYRIGRTVYRLKQSEKSAQAAH